MNSQSLKSVSKIEKLEYYSNTVLMFMLISLAGFVVGAVVMIFLLGNI